jgi:hypothetical protein
MSKRLGKLIKYNDHIGTRTRDLRACSLVLQPLRYRGLPSITHVQSYLHTWPKPRYKETSPVNSASGLFAIYFGLRLQAVTLHFDPRQLTAEISDVAERRHNKPILDAGARWIRYVSLTPRQLCQPAVPTLHEGGPDAVQYRTFSCLCRESNLGRPARSPSLHWLSYLGFFSSYLVYFEMDIRSNFTGVTRPKQENPPNYT